MIKFLATSILAVLLALPALCGPNLQVLVDQQPLSFDQPPIMQEGRVLVPLRGVFESLGADVVYLASSRTIKATRGRTQVELTLGSRSAMVDGRSVYLDVPAISHGGRTMVPLRFVSEALGADVDWQAATRTVSITSAPSTGQPPPPVTPPPAGRLNIQNVLHSATGALQPGDTLQVTMTGDPNGQASFDVPGAFESVPMREVRPGSYQGSVTIPKGLEIEQGRVVAHLVGNGLESQMEASRPVTFGTGQQAPTPTGSNVRPLPNSTVNQARPLIQMQFERNARPETVRLLLDGQDVTGSAVINQRLVRFTPGSNLQRGRHHVNVIAQDNQGRPLGQQWNFNVNVGQAASGSIQLTNLSDGMTVNRVFNIQGHTVPHSNVRAIGRSSQDLIPGVIGVRGPDIETQTTSDATGWFNLQMNASALPSNTVLETTIQATDPNGQPVGPVHIKLIVR